LPFTSRFHPIIYIHIYLLPTSDSNGPSKNTEIKEVHLPKTAQLKILQALEQQIDSMVRKQNTEWSNYYNQINYQEASFQSKKNLIKKWCTSITALKIIDLRGNDVTFAKELLDQSDHIIVSDIDQPAIDQCYLNQLKSNEG
jgi:hypothetical protein